MLKYLIVSFFVCFNLSYVISSVFNRGNAQIVLEFINPCKNAQPKLELELFLERCNKTHRCVRGWLTFDETTDYHYNAEVYAHKWADGGWKDNAFHVKFPDACKSIQKLIGKNWKTFITCMGIDSCPFPAGRYNITDFYPDFSDIPVALMYGKYNFVLHITKFNELMMCREFVANVIQ